MSYDAALVDKMDSEQEKRFPFGYAGRAGLQC
jgi:hypothetical protein